MGALYKEEPTGDPVSIAIILDSPIPHTSFLSSHLHLHFHIFTLIFISKTSPPITFFLQLAPSAHEVALRFAAALHEYLLTGREPSLHGMHVPGLLLHLSKLPCKKGSFNILEAVRSLELPCTSLHTSPSSFYTNPPHHLPQRLSNHPPCHRFLLAHFAFALFLVQLLIPLALPCSTIQAVVSSIASTTELASSCKCSPAYMMDPPCPP